MKKLSKVFVGLTAVTAVLMLAACGAAPGASTASSGNEIGKTFKIGYDIEMTGAVAAYGESGSRGADMAVAELNADGGINGKKIEVIKKDNKSDNAEAATVAANLMSNDKVNAVIGTNASSSTKAMIPNATKFAVPIVAPTATNDELTHKDGKVEKYVFRAIFPDSFQGKVISNFVTDTLVSDTVAVYYDNSSDYAKGLYQNFKKNYKGKIVEVATYQAGEKDFQAQLSKLSKEKFGTLLVLGYYQEAGILVKQARELGIEVPVIGGDVLADPTFAELAGPEAASDIYFVSGFSSLKPANDKTANFIKNYKEKFGEEPSAYAACAYDSVMMVAAAAKAEKAKTSVDVAEGLAKLKDFEGVTGTITIDKNHDPVKSAYLVKLEKAKEVSADIVKP
ncbi:branched-chain amino acid ABC transporter substrate-binding protein [Lactococcus hodotermopsidis]|uniref:Branched-chain amino acid ABC transporter substrate-binding protein n=1 Tax=Pseudolactococcus hodotermopsidis TaxID=2709157 RepID=A0A6A0BBU7_9LACT|nr:ABC transporter substrate-binding protein [Lactococcus hodotermopsidis]GFH42919.1 branched-chain amino acid ABC transporter substrate-binding protein [Lactococcus hodotermopsidis]